jgi:hypothetical protein
MPLPSHAGTHPSADGQALPKSQTPSAPGASLEVSYQTLHMLSTLGLSELSEHQWSNPIGGGTGLSIQMSKLNVRFLFQLSLCSIFAINLCLCLLAGMVKILVLVLQSCNLSTQSSALQYVTFQEKETSS